MVAGIGIILEAPIPGGDSVRASNHEGAIEFRLAERADTQRPSFTGFVTLESRRIQYRVAESVELKLRRAELTEVRVHETEPGRYALALVVDQSLWTTIESITAAYLGNRLAIFVEGSLVLVAVVQMSVPDGTLVINHPGDSKEEVFAIARRFSPTPGFLPLDSTGSR
ncbi:MAG: hypothetical protein ACRDGM_03695 [bacterium]